MRATRFLRVYRNLGKVLTGWVKPPSIEPPDRFYRDVVKELMRLHILFPNMRILVACGDMTDRDVLVDLRFRDVTITNLDMRVSSTEFQPFSWSYQNVENITFDDNSFDFAIVHNGLHHCYSPHRGLLELYRVSRQGILVFEPRDTLLVRLGVRLNFGQQYEIAAVSDHALQFGGVGNTHIPNFIYRWTEREIEKTISSYEPRMRSRYLYMYAFRIPWARLRMLRSRTLLSAILVVIPVMKIVFRILPKQANGFAFIVQKSRPPDNLHPWLKWDGGEVVVDHDWVRKRYT